MAGQEGGQGAGDDKALAEMVAGLIAAAFKTHLPGAIEAAVKPHAESIAALRSQLEGMGKPSGEKPGEKPGNGGDDTASRLATMEKLLATERDGRKADKMAAGREKALAALRGELTGKVRPEMTDAVAKLLFHAEQAVAVDESGTATFKLGTDAHDIAGGVAAWLKTPAAAAFLPAPGYTPGSAPGKRPGAPAVKRPTDAAGKPAPEAPRTKEQRVAGRLAALGGGTQPI